MTSWTDMVPLRFGVCGDDVEIIIEPENMYSKILELVQNSKKRIGIASLYLGNGQLERALVDNLKLALKANQSLEVQVLLDYCRGSRGEDNSRTMLLPCVKEHKERICVSLFHTPNLKGIVKRFLPDRFNELLGLQHMKLYVFDDTILLSGANLSNDYFTNRQDRCLMIKNSPALSLYFYSLIQTVSQFSYQLDSNNVARLHSSCLGDPSKSSGTKSFINHSASCMKKFMSEHTKGVDSCDAPDTWLYPILQMAPFGVEQEHSVLKRLFQSGHCRDRVYMATAYFNPLQQYIDIMADVSKSEYHLLTASPQANGFTTASGIARYIPMAYRWYESFFLKRMSACSQADRVKLYEFSRNGWTFHSKGIWYYARGSSLPSLTVIGSSNYGYRSVHRDLEAQMIISTENKGLQERLHQEKEALFSRSDLLEPSISDRIVRKFPLWTRIISRLCRHWF
ncbi:CDP-diacylglycerol--glycerol-3-phosphate 3-phosphatidyltransferase, mitochondrial-like [Watersipora subatra]|uniref:CDP-diacylglycerol--glycerol-3-phosphate 3-phosphatidyltransferase, mitochondrial-like n=1 Tax=Watersipora subatra TaxID=2589382 RepID=UPI00355BBDD0